MRTTADSMSEATIFYTLFDVHYYLGGWQPLHPGRVLLVGGDFATMPGRYVLPLHEGQYTVYR